MVNMNTEIDNEAKALALSLSPEIVETCKAVNNTLATTEAVKAHYGTHYAQAELGVCGIVAMVKDILREAQAVFPRGIENSDFRKIAVAASLFTSDIVRAVEERFASAGMRYKRQVVCNVLSADITDSFCKIQLTNAEDKPRPAGFCKPRCKWYLIDKPELKAA